MKRLRAFREARRWSQAELARRSGVNPVTVGLIERGRFIPYPGQVAKLAAALEVAESELLEVETLDKEEEHGGDSL